MLLKGVLSDFICSILLNRSGWCDIGRIFLFLIPISFRFVGGMIDALNAEIALGTVSNVNDAMQWISYTYLFVRMQRNPMAYGEQCFRVSQIIKFRNTVFRDPIRRTGRRS